MKKIVIVILIFATTSCSHYYYAPNAANIPLFKEKNNLEVKGGFSGDNYSGADIQTAYSVNKKIAVMVNSFFAGETENVQESISNSSSHEESGKGNYIEAAAGYYKSLGLQKTWIFETYGGAGVGGETHDYANLQTAKLHLTKYFIQPSIGYSAKKGHFEAAIGSRFSVLNLKINQSNLSVQANQGEKQNLDTITLHPSSFLWEPSFLIAAGGKDFKLYLQLTFANNLSNPYVPIDNANVSFGVKINFTNDQKQTNVTNK